MTRTTVRTARKAFRCDCGGTIRPGDAYYEHVASPHHGDLGNPGWWRIRECGWCGTRHGRTLAGAQS